MVLEIAKKMPETRFVMVGGAVRKHERYYDQIMEEAKAVGNLTCTGFLPFSEADRLFEDATVFLNTSAVEGFPNTYLQAWSRGVPVVGSFDPDEVICEHGLGVHFRTVDEAVDALQSLCTAEAETLQAIGERATAYVRQNHSPDVVIGQIEALLEDLQCSS
jgi:glycosyltransferase involved in cell wall biosynthesis